MNIAVLSDIHANRYALEAVLLDIETLNIDAVWCLGDIVGRGFNPIDVAMDMYRLYNAQTAEHKKAWLAGNHDMLVTERIPLGFLKDDEFSVPSSLSAYNGDTVRIAEQHNRILRHRHEIMKWLNDLPTYSTLFGRVYLAHAAYRYNEETKVIDINETFQRYITDGVGVSRLLGDFVELTGNRNGLVMGGHSHISGVWEWDDNAKIARQIFEISEFDLEHQLIYVNTGSVGFPREADQDPTYVLIKTDEQFLKAEIALRTVIYDKAAIEFPVDYPEVYKREMLRGNSISNVTSISDTAAD